MAVRAGRETVAVVVKDLSGLVGRHRCRTSVVLVFLLLLSQTRRRGKRGGFAEVSPGVVID
jgi:hypothetical protein